MPGQPRQNVPLAPYTTIGLGGPARWFSECASEADLRAALAFAQGRNLPIHVLGGGSNVVFADAGFPGLVVRVVIPGVEFGRDGETVTAGAGVDWDPVVREAVDRGLQGIECLSGIPGTVGGTPIQNVGAYGQEVSETIQSVLCLDRNTLKRVALAADECGFRYRTSRFKEADRDRFIVLEVKFRLRTGAPPALKYAELADAVRAKRGRGGGIEGRAPPEGLRRVRETVLELRRRKSMVLDPDDPNARSVGSFFTNPVLSPERFAELVEGWRTGGGSGPVPSFPADGRVKVPAAWLIERAGFAKGLRRGGVGISRNHALALVNHGGTAGQLVALARDIQAGVRAKFGVGLTFEPVVLEGRGG